MNFSPEGHFLCDVCNFELIDNDDAETVKGQEDAMARFNSQTAYIQEGLRKTAEMVFPLLVLCFTSWSLIEKLRSFVLWVRL